MSVDAVLATIGDVRLAFGTDEETALTTWLVDLLSAAGHDVAVVGHGEEWPEVGRAVGTSVAGGSADLGVVCCTTGTGVCIAANKVAGVRAALCTDGPTVAGARRWNDANVLAFGLRLTSQQVLAEMVEAFLTTAVDPGEAARARRVEPGVR